MPQECFFNVDRDDDALTAKGIGRLPDELWILEGVGIDGHLFGPKAEDSPDVFQAFDSANNYRLEVVVPESVYLSALNLFQRWGVTVDDWRTFKD